MALRRRLHLHPRGSRVLLLAVGIALLAALGVGTVAGVAGLKNGGGGQSGTTLNAYKTAEGFWVRRLEYDWSVSKQASPTSLEIKPGETKPVQYTISAARTLASQTDLYGVRGQVCVTNGGDVMTKGLKLVDQVQYQTGSGPYQDIPGATQTIVPTAQLTPGETQCYDYEVLFTPISGATYRNTVKVTITNHSGFLGEPFGPEPKADFSIPSTFTTVYVDTTATLYDVQSIPAGFTGQTSQTFPVTFTDSGQVSFTKHVTNVSAACGQQATLSNTATLTEDDTGQVRQASTQVLISTGMCPPTPTPTPSPKPTVSPPPSGEQGCTPGYWKNHLGSWVGYAPSQSVVSVFIAAAPYAGADSLLTALGYKGGKTTQGAAQNLLRAGVAAVLNAANPNVNYPRSVSQVVADVNTILASGNRTAMQTLASALDADNNLGCPLP